MTHKYLMIYNNDDDWNFTLFDEQYNKSIIPENASTEEAIAVAWEWLMEWVLELEIDDNQPIYGNYEAVLYKIDEAIDINLEKQIADHNKRIKQRKNQPEYNEYLRLKEKYDNS